MDKIQAWINQKGDGAAVALCAMLQPLGVSEADLANAIAADRKSQVLEQLAGIRKRAESEGVSKDEWEKIEPRLDTVAVEEPK